MRDFILKMIFKIIYYSISFQLRSTVRALETGVSRFWKLGLKTADMYVSVLGAGVTAHIKHYAKPSSSLSFCRVLHPIDVRQRQLQYRYGWRVAVTAIQPADLAGDK
jgi:hypothetical protein